MTKPPFWFASLLRRYSRIAISGGPLTGKTTLAATVTDRPVFGTDEVMHLPWEEVPQAVIKKARELGDSWVIEGVQVPRALRKGLRPQVVIDMTDQKAERTPGQVAMALGVRTVFEDWRAANPGHLIIAEGTTWPGGPR